MYLCICLLFMLWGQNSVQILDICSKVSSMHIYHFITKLFKYFQIIFKVKLDFKCVTENYVHMYCTCKSCISVRSLDLSADKN